MARDHSLVNASDISHFADRRPREAQEFLPHIICRLLAATPGIEGLTAPSGDGIMTRGWDICVEEAPGSHYVPGGPSRWELGTDADPRTKANRDYADRKRDPKGVDPSKTTVVFVSMRRWITKLEWRDKRRAEKFWQDVQVKDADDIFNWLETNPAVHRWVTERICGPGSPKHHTPPAQLPPDVPGFVGRHDELRDILHTATHPDQANIVVLTGQPGAGKTALAVHFAHRHRADFPDGQIYVDLRGMHDDAVDPRAVVVRLLRALGAQDDEIDGSPDEQQALYRTLCHDKKVLVILDNAADERQVRPIIAGGPHCLTVVTSRNSLSGLDGVRRVSVGTLPRRTALDMLAEITSAERVSAQYPSAELICQLCGFLPLALRIAGTLAVKRRGWSLDDLARRLSDECRRLDQLKVGDVAVRASFQLSYDRLDPATQAVFRRIPLVPGPDFNVALLSHAVEAGLRAGLEDELELLAELNLIGYSGRDARYNIHDLLRLYAEDNLRAYDPAEAVNAARESVTDHLLGTATQSSQALLPGTPVYQPGEPLREALAWLDDNIANVLAAYTLAVKRKDHQAIFPASMALPGYLQRRKMWAVEKGMIDSALGLLDWVRRLPGCRHDEADRVEFVLLQGLCEAGLDGRDYQLTLDTCDRIDTLGKKANIELAGVSSLNYRGKVCEEQHRYDDALTYFRRALRICRENGHTDREGLLLHNIGNILSQLGKSEEGLAYLHRDLDECRRRGDTQGEAHTLNSIAHAHSRSGDNPRAERLLAEAIKKYQECHDIRHEADAQNDRGVILRILGRPREALECHRRDLAVCENLKDDRGSALAHIHIAFCLIDISKDNADEATRHARAAMSLADPRQDIEIVGSAHLALGGISDATGNLDEALEHYAQAATLAAQARSFRAQASALCKRGTALMKQGRYDHAIRELTAALEIYETLNACGEQAFTLTVLAESAAKAGALDAAQQYLARVHQIALELGILESDNKQNPLAVEPSSSTHPAS